MVVVGGVVIAVAAVVVGMRLFARSLLARRVRLEDELVRHGVETTATVRETPPPQRGWNRNGGVWRQVSFAFVDTDGVEHSVVRRMLIRTPGAVSAGQTSRLWYDRSAPDDGS